MKIIAEIKKASPIGILRENIDVPIITQEFERNGASVISIVTAEQYQGNKEWIKQAAAATKLPILRKDYIESVDQLKETVDLGATWVMLIAGMVTPKKLNELVYYSHRLGLRPTVAMNSMLDAAALKASDSNSVMLVNPATNNIPDLKFTADVLKIIPDQYEISVSNGLSNDWNFVDSLRKTKIVDYICFGTFLMINENLEAAFQKIKQHVNEQHINQPAQATTANS
jgi:indole-3-glycerol phosphate synthase